MVGGVDGRGMKYTCVNERQDNGAVIMQGREAAGLNDIKCMGSLYRVTESAGGTGGVWAGWNG